MEEVSKLEPENTNKTIFKLMDPTAMKQMKKVIISGRLGEKMFRALNY